MAEISDLISKLDADPTFETARNRDFIDVTLPKKMEYKDFRKILDEIGFPVCPKARIEEHGKTTTYILPFERHTVRATYTAPE